MSGIVAARHLHIALQTTLDHLEGVLADDGWHWNRNPFRCGGGLLTLPHTDGLQGRFPAARRYWAGASAIRCPSIGWGSQDAAHRGDIPAWAPPGRGNLRLTEAFGDFI